jgi:hypothetical protein
VEEVAESGAGEGGLRYSKRMRFFLPLSAALVLTVAAVGAEGVTLEADSVMRRDLPNDFPLHLLDAGFAILQVRLENHSDDSVEFDVDRVEAYSPRKRRLERALPTEIAPELIKYYRSGSRDLHGRTESRWPRYPTDAHRRRSPTVGTGPGMIDAGMGTQLRETLERYEVKSAVLGPGQSLEGFLYVKSKDSGQRLSGGFLKVGERTASF